VVSFLVEHIDVQLFVCLSSRTISTLFVCVSCIIGLPVVTGSPNVEISGS